MIRLVVVLAPVLACLVSAFVVHCNESRVVNGFDLNDYHSFAEIADYVNSLKNERVSVETLGLSSEQRPIPIVKINRNAKHSSRKQMTGQKSTCTSFQQSIPTAMNSQEHTIGFGGNSRSGKLKCGADLNRNYENHWAETGTSNKKCSEIYHGRKPFSEPESRAVGDFMVQHLSELQGYVSLHAFENAILVPYGYQVYAKPTNYEELFLTAKQVAASMNSVHNNNYTIMKSSSLYPAAGCSDDYAKGIGIRYSYTIELTTGFYQGKYVGFQTPKQMIGQTSDEVRAGLVKLMQIIVSQP
ncbi:Carboxypeptidase B-like protein [Aphelenchoides bicaudatus]|nr:Carboxypeptidase B-like protein [Aphelenchoides bicaudatus]